MKARCAVFPRGYLPMDCPTCGRRRLEYGVNDEGGVIYVECEKCSSNSDDETLWSPRSLSHEERAGVVADEAAHIVSRPGCSCPTCREG